MCRWLAETQPTERVPRPDDEEEQKNLLLRQIATHATQPANRIIGAHLAPLGGTRNRSPKESSSKRRARKGEPALRSERTLRHC